MQITPTLGQLKPLLAKYNSIQKQPISAVSAKFTQESDKI